MKILIRAWNWYAKITGWEMSQLQKRTGLRIQSTAFPTLSQSKTPRD